MTSDAVARGPARSAAVAAGSSGTVRAGVEVLRAGGSAVDAALACAFAAAVHEPVLASVGGGGFLLHAPAGAPAQVLDFFVAVPGIDAGPTTPDMRTVVVDFSLAGPAAGASLQAFHGGWGTVAVPGVLAGLLDAHRRWGRVPLAEVVAPAARAAREGVALSAVQRTFLDLTADLVRLTEASATLMSEAVATGRFRNERYAALLDSLAVHGIDLASFDDELLVASRGNGGQITADDLADYRPIAREPLRLERRGAVVLTNPAPSAGGPIVAEAWLGTADGRGRIDWGALIGSTADALDAHRSAGQVPTGTTHISVVDADGDLAALTLSNGSGSGTVLEGWGVALNNMLGEEDLAPLAPLAPGARMGSMMAPTLVEHDDGSRTVLGTGGSERIRSATLGVLALMVDAGLPLDSAIAAPRVHLGAGGRIHVEPGLDAVALASLEREAARRGWPGLELWPATSVYFGGVHAVRRSASGDVLAVGDARRGGAAAVVLPGGDVAGADGENAAHG